MANTSLVRGKNQTQRESTVSLSSKQAVSKSTNRPINPSLATGAIVPILGTGMEEPSPAWAKLRTQRDSIDSHELTDINCVRLTLTDLEHSERSVNQISVKNWQTSNVSG